MIATVESCVFRLRALTTAVVFVGTVAGQTGWRQEPSALSLPSWDHVMAWDSSRSTMVLANQTDTWERVGSTWRRVAGGSVFDSDHAAADSGRGLVYAWHRIGLLAWDGASWRASWGLPVEPGARTDPAFAYDSRRGRLVLFGGDVEYVGEANDTWEYDGTSWLQVDPGGAPHAARPPARRSHAMVYDAARDEIVLFGGQQLGAIYGDTWVYRGGAWRQMAPSVQPPVKTSHKLLYDDARQRVVMLAGQRLLNDAWEWDGTNWSQRLGSAPLNLFGNQAMAYDPTLGRILVHDYLSSQAAWSYGPVQPASAGPYGAGCPPQGSAVAPVLAAAAGALPWLGDPFELQATNVAAQASACLLVGGSSTAWQGYVLPLSLGFVGLPGCSLLAAPDVVLSGAPAGNPRVWSLPLPSQSGLLGVVFHAQGLHVAPAGVSLTNGMTMQVGGR